MNRGSRPHCSYCNYTNHKTTDCRYKTTYIKRIDKVNGRLKKTYNTARSPNSIEFVFNSKNNDNRHREESRTSKPESNNPKKQRHSTEEVTFIEEVKTNNKKEEKDSDSKSNKLPQHITQQTKYPKCLQCLRWEIRLQENSKIVERLTNETLKLHKEKKDLEKEKIAYRKLFEATL